MATYISQFVQQHPNNDHQVFQITFFQDAIETLVTDTPSYVDNWISRIESIHRRRLHSLIVGLDVEWRPSYTRNFENPVATLQLCVGRLCLVFQILHSPAIPQSLVNFLANPSYTFVGVGIGEDIAKLRRDYNLVVARTLDLRTVAAEAYDHREFRNAGLRQLASSVLGTEMSKPKRITMSRWDNEFLTPEQVQYATIDAFVCFEIGRVLIAG